MQSHSHLASMLVLLYLRITYVITYVLRITSIVGHLKVRIKWNCLPLTGQRHHFFQSSGLWGHYTDYTGFQFQAKFHYKLSAVLLHRDTRNTFKITGGRCSNRSISPARWAHSSKPAAAGLLLWARAGTDRLADRQMDGPPHRFTYPAPHIMSSAPMNSAKNEYKLSKWKTARNRCVQRMLTNRPTYTVSQKNKTPNSWPQLH